MTDTIRERIIQAFLVKAAPLSNVEIVRARRSVGEGQERFISAWDGEDNTTDSRYGQDTMEFPMLLICEWDPGDVNPSVAVNAMMGEITSAILSTDFDLGGLVEDMARLSMTPTYPNDGSNICILTAAFRIRYKTKRGNPYEQLA